MAHTMTRTFAEPPRKNYTLVAKCYSEDCATSPWGNKPAIKTMPRGAKFCHDCGCAVVWERVETEEVKK